MDRAIGLSSGLGSLVSLTVESSTALCRTLKSFQNKETAVRDLRNEAQDLDSVLRTLQDTLDNMTVEVDILRQPLTRCRDACRDFNTLINESTEHSTAERTSIWDWLKLRYMGEDITGFKNMLAGYKSTVIIALVFNNILTTKSTKDVLDEYKELIETTKSDLEVHLRDIKHRLQIGIAEDQTLSKIEASERQRMEQERESTQQSLKLCAETSAYMENMIQSCLPASITSPSETFNPVSSLAEPSLDKLMLAEALISAQKTFISTRLRLQQNLHSTKGQVHTPQYHWPQLEARERIEQSLEEEVDSITDSLSLCDRAATQEGEIRRNFFEDVSVGDDSKQFIVSVKELISAKRVKAGDRTIQVMGQITGPDLQSVSRGHYHSTEMKDK